MDARPKRRSGLIRVHEALIPTAREAFLERILPASVDYGRTTGVIARGTDLDDAFRRTLLGPVYEDNTDITRFILATLAEDQMTKETWVDPWQRQKRRFDWTIEHILPQGANLPQEWIDMLGGAEQAAAAQARDVHRLGNLTITRYNSSLSNKSFQEKTDRVDSQGRPIGYKNGLSLNTDLLGRQTWTVSDIEERTDRLADCVIERFSIDKK